MHEKRRFASNEMDYREEIGLGMDTFKSISAKYDLLYRRRILKKLVDLKLIKKQGVGHSTTYMINE